MPQGTVIAIRPLGSSKNLSDKEIMAAGCHGVVEIIGGDHDEKLGYFIQEGGSNLQPCCVKRPHRLVEIEIKEVDSYGRVFVKLKDC